jgi:hypothetical protein
MPAGISQATPEPSFKDSSLPHGLEDARDGAAGAGLACDRGA